MWLFIGAVVMRGSRLHAKRSCGAVPLGRGCGGASVPCDARGAVSPSPAESRSSFCIQVLCALDFCEHSSCLYAQSARAKMLSRSCGDPGFMWLPAAQPGFSLNESSLCSRLLLCICSSLLNWQSCIVCIIRIEQWALHVGRLNKPSSRRFQ